MTDGEIERLTVEGKIDNENVWVQVLTPPSTWTTRITISSTSDSTQTWDLDSNEYNSGSPSVKFVDVSGADATKSNLWLDWVKSTA